MSEDLWKKLNGIKKISSISETAWRIIEGQEYISTRKLVDSLEEQIILEEMLEASKPFLLSEEEGYHALLYTPFRYPPLEYGSRFGNRSERGIWYGSLKIGTAMAEKAYYLFYFIRGSTAKLGLVQTPLTLFSANIKTKHGVDLTKAPFDKYQHEISSPRSYEISQNLGSAMRKNNVEAFTFFSARHLNEKNIGVYSISAFRSKKPNQNSFQSWNCSVTANKVEFTRANWMNIESYSFTLASFLMDGVFPSLP